MTYVLDFLMGFFSLGPETDLDHLALIYLIRGLVESRIYSFEPATLKDFEAISDSSQNG